MMNFGVGSRIFSQTQNGMSLGRFSLERNDRAVERLKILRILFVKKNYLVNIVDWVSIVNPVLSSKKQLISELELEESSCELNKIFDLFEIGDDSDSVQKRSWLRNELLEFKSDIHSLLKEPLKSVCI